MQLANGSWADRIPAWIKWATQKWDEIQFNGVYYQPPSAAEPGVYDPNKSYVFKYPRPTRPRALRVYECHVGMSSEEEKVNSYLEFKDEMVPRVRRLGYNCIQIMAIQVLTDCMWYMSMSTHDLVFSRHRVPQSTQLQVLHESSMLRL